MRTTEELLSEVYRALGASIDDVTTFERLKLSGVVNHSTQLRPLYHWESAAGEAVCAGMIGGAQAHFWRRGESLEPRAISQVALVYNDSDRASEAAEELRDWTLLALVRPSSSVQATEPGPSLHLGEEPRWSLQDQILLSNGDPQNRVHFIWRHRTVLLNMIVSGVRDNATEAEHLAVALENELSGRDLSEDE
jgi:hypothetical protein